MNVNEKALLIIAFIFEVSIVITGVAARTILLSNYLDMEQQDVTEHLSIIKNNFEAEASHLSELNRQMASWDRTYEFMVKKNPSYIHSYLTDQIFKDAELSLILLVNTEGKLVYSKVLDQDTAGLLPIQADLLKMIEDGGILARHAGDNKCGIFMSPNGPMILSASPILTSNGAGPLRGTLIIGKYLDSGFYQALSAGVPDVFISLSEIGKKDAVFSQEAESSLLKNPERNLIRVVDEKRVSGYMVLYDIQNRPAAVLQIDEPRDLYEQGKRALTYLVIILMLTGLAVAGASNYFFKRFFISDLVKIEGFVTAVKEEKNLSKRLYMDRKDEFTHLSAGINSMLENLEISQSELVHRESEKQALLNSLNEVLIFLDSDLRIIWANDRASEYFGMQPEDIIGRSHRDLWGPKSVSLEPFVKKALNNGKPESFEIKLGEKVWSINIGSVRDNKLKLLGAVESILDITEIKKAEEKMLQAKTLAENANRSKSEFLSNMSHELRTPLNSVIGFAELLMEESFGPLNEKQLKYTDNILNSGKHLLRLINNILDISKIEAGKMDLVCLDFSVKEKFEEVKTLLIPVFSKKNISLDYSIEEGITTIYTDEVKFVEILYNLLTNAIKFTPPDGSVSFRARKIGEKLEISIKDTGIGIKEKDQERIFQPFVQVDSSSSRLYGGTGLGLTLVKKMVTLMGGEIWVKSKLGEGSEFSYTIPITPEIAQVKAS